MITGAHFLLYSRDADADRAFLRDALGFRAVDAGGGWLILALPPAEIGVHPAEGDAGALEDGLSGASLWLMCDDLEDLVASLRKRGVDCAPAQEADWGRFTSFALPSGARLGAYLPRHATAIAR